MRTIKPLITILALAAIAFGIYYFFFPPPEKVIRKRMTRLAEAISAKPQGNIATVANVNRIGSYFHPNISITVEGFGQQISSVQGRGELQQMAMAARQRVGSVAVEFYNLQVQVGAEKTNAIVTATALVKINDDANPMMQEMRFEFAKVDRDWLIHSAAPVKSP